MQSIPYHRYTAGSIPKNLWRFAVPFMLSNALQVVYSLVDMIVVGQYVGSFVGHPVLHLVNTPAESYDYTWDYFLVCTLGNVFTFDYNMVSAVLRDMGDSKRPFIFVAIASATFGTGVKIDDVVNRITYGLSMAGSSMVGQAVVWSFPGMLLMRGTNALMNGIDNSFLNLIFGLLDGVVLRISLSYLFGIVWDMGLYGFFLGYGLAAYGTSIPGTIYYLSGKWKRYQMLKK